jgi:aminopeptidase N
MFIQSTKPFLLFLLMLLALAGFGQDVPDMHDHECKGYGLQRYRAAAKTTVASTAEDDYDVHYLKFDLQLSDTNTYIIGSVSATATVVAAAMPAYVFELDDTLTVDSVVIDGASLPFTTSGKIRTVPLPAPLAGGSMFTARVYYHGKPFDKRNVHLPGFHTDSATRITFSSIEPYFAHEWWPCKQSLGDKIDSLDMQVTVANGIRVGSNGLLAAIVPVGADYSRYEWKSRYPIDYYLISVSVSRYDEYSYYMHFDGSSDSMLMMNYISKDTPLSIAQLKPWLDSTALVINYFSGLFGRYPFWKEKYGHCYIPSFVNMEHQTMTSTRFSRFTVIVHELAHQWFGDAVTCATWQDIWLNEGFAAYAQYLAYDHYDGRAKAQEYLKKIHDNTKTDPRGSVYVGDTTDWQRIFDGRLTYDKGASVIHMLRFVVNDDAQFFGMLTGYLQKYRWGNANTEEFRKYAEQYTGLQLGSFFDQWIYGQGHPQLTATWNQEGDAVLVRIDEVSANPTIVPLFTLPVEVRCYSAQGDTSFRANITQPSKVYSFNCGLHIDSVAIDPDNWLLCERANTTLKDELLSLSAGAYIYPNPTGGKFSIAYRNMPDAALVVYDVSGRKAAEHKLQWDTGTEEIDISLLPKGIYIYRISSGGKTRVEGKVVRE